MRRGRLFALTEDFRMAQEPSPVEQALSRALRDNLATLQRTAEELRAAVDDVVSACSSAKPTNALPPMLRAQTAAASLAASMDVLAKFIAAALQPPQRTPAEEAVLRAVSAAAPPPAAEPGAPPRTVPTPMADVAAAPVEAAPPPPPPVVEAPPPPEPAPDVEEEAPAAVEAEAAAEAPAPAPVEAEAFDVKSLPHEQQELHRKANRHAKVSMQDIKMYRKAEVKLGQENKDLCSRLREDIDKARKEYDRRFKAIHNHPVDYFYDWMVQILADGDAEKLGDYPYPSPVHRR